MVKMVGTSERPGGQENGFVKHGDSEGDIASALSSQASVIHQ